jgi:hypothetical protein
MIPMAKKKLLEDIKLRPARFYRSPMDVGRDRRFNDEERLEILRAWMAMGADIPQIENLIAEIEARRISHAAE